MKRMILLVMLFISVTFYSIAQTIEIKGKIKDSQTLTPIEFANIVLQTSEFAFITGNTSDKMGNFTLIKINPGEYQLIISCIGFPSQTIQLGRIDKTVTLDDILLESNSVELKETTVTASNLRSQMDKKIIHPSERQVKASTNGINLLQQLMLPKIQVNPLFNEISLPNGGELQVRINGVKVEIAEIQALQPSEIIRIEFHDNPGLRYGNAEVVLDYIVHRPETGGSFGAEVNQAVKTKWGNDYFNGKINHKKSELALYYSINYRNFDHAYRNNEENFLFADGSILQRRENGDPGHLQMNWQNVSATYSFNEPDKMMFNATLRYYHRNQPHFDYQGILYNINEVTDKVNMIDKSKEKNHRPAIDLYYQQSLPHDQTLVINIVGTYNNTNSTRIYQESRDYINLTDVHNIVIGDKYSLIGEGIYEKKLGINRISTGLRYSHSFSDNEYRNGHTYTTNMDQSETFAYAEFIGKIKKLDYSIGAGMARSWFSQENTSNGYQDYTFHPRLILQYNIRNRSHIRLKSSLSKSNPSLSNINAIEQVVDSIQLQRGNPHLKPYYRYQTELTYELQKGIFYGNLWNLYEYQPNAIMEEKYQEGNKIIQTWNNQKNWQRLASRLTLRVGPIKEILQFSMTGGVNHYRSNGNDYAHRYTNWFTNMNISSTYKKWMLAFGLETNWNWFYGETLNGGENIHYLMLQYTHKNLALTFGAFNPFMDNYKVDTENWSQYANYKKSMYIEESSRMFLVKASYNFSFGRKFKAGDKRLNNRDDDSGVMSTGK